MTRGVADAFKSLSGELPSTAIFSYDKIWRAVKQRAGAQVQGVSVGYPHFFDPNAVYGYCQGIRAVDQLWMVQQIDSLNEIARTAARKNGMRFADPNDPNLSRTFKGHEFCSPDPWFHGITHPGQVHPDAFGQSEMGAAVSAALAGPLPPTFVVKPRQTVTQSIAVSAGQRSLNVNTTWPGSDVVLTLRSPSGRVIIRQTSAPDVQRETSSTWERVEVSKPEVGTWVAELYGLDVAPDGEPTTLDVYQEPLPNMTPQARPSLRVEGTELVVDGRPSTALMEPSAPTTGTSPLPLASASCQVPRFASHAQAWSRLSRWLSPTIVASRASGTSPSSQ